MKKFIANEILRLDVFLSKHLQVPRNQVFKLICDHGIWINEKKITKASFMLKLQDKIMLNLPKTNTTKPKYKVDFDVDILYEDEHIMIINKAPNLVVHPAPSVKEATLVDYLKYKNIRLSTLSGEERHGIVHRIDKQTSGALIVAKSNKAHKELSRQLENKSLGRYYLCITDLPLKENCIVEKPIGRNPKNRLKMGIVFTGKEAKSAFCNLLISKKSSFALLAAKLFTGRTHQIRVHLQSLSRHILGDDLYGFKTQKAKIPRVMLHAYIIYLNHPITKKPLCVEAPLFDDFKEIYKKYFSRTKEDEIFQKNFILRSFSSYDSWLHITV